MKLDTLRSVTAEISERQIDPWLESHLSPYANEVKAVLAALHVVSRRLSRELEPASVFSLKQK